MVYAPGADLGTTYTAAAIYRDGRVETVSLGSHANTIPTVAYARESGEILVGGFMRENEFFERYERHAGLVIDPQSLYFYKVYIAWLQGVISLGTAWRVAYNGKTHQDALVAWIVGIGPKLIDGLRELLEQGA